MAPSSASPLAPPPSPAGPPPLAIRDGAARDRDGAAMPLGGDRLQNDTPPMLLGSPPLATRDPARDGSAVQLGGGQLEMDEMDEEGRTRHHARMCAAPLPLPPQPTAAVSRNEEAGLNRQPAPHAWARAYEFSVQKTGFISQNVLPNRHPALLSARVFLC